MILALALLASAAPETAYEPGIKIGTLKQPKVCKKIVTKTCLVYCHVIGRVVGQSLPMVDTYKQGKPIHFKMTNKKVVPGIINGLLGACLGETRQITIPPNLAYQDDFVDGVFPPGSSWIAQIEIVNVVDEGEY